jgi:hypothetical protein
MFTAFSGSELGPLVVRWQSGFEHRVPTRFANPLLTLAGNSSRFAHYLHRYLTGSNEDNNRDMSDTTTRINDTM